MIIKTPDEIRLLADLFSRPVSAMSASQWAQENNAEIERLGFRFHEHPMDPHVTTPSGETLDLINPVGEISLDSPPTRRPTWHLWTIVSPPSFQFRKRKPRLTRDDILQAVRETRRVLRDLEPRP